jgi:N-acetylmuramoyl-L-alanine amidase
MRWSNKLQFPVPNSGFSERRWARRTENWELRTRVYLAVLLATVTLLSAASTVEEKHISVYSPVAIYTLPVLQRAGHEYVGILELLEPLGRVSSESDGRRLRLRYNAVDAEFATGKTKAKIRGRDFDFTTPFLIENSRGFIPLSSLSALLPRFLGTAVNFRESTRRLFISDVGVRISFKLEAGAPPRLALNFSAPVNPTISTEPGKLRMIFKRDPVVSPGSQSISFADKVITQASYSENNGDAELDVFANEPLMANFANNRKTIVISAVEPGTVANGTLATAASQPASQNPSQTSFPQNSGSQTVSQNPQLTPSSPPAATPTTPNFHRPLAVVDPAHGGDERGAALTNTLAEKDVTLGFARLLRHELELRGFSVLLLRDADTTLTLDQRAAAANVARAVIYIGLHADSLGSGARVYTSLLPVEGQSNGTFHPWNSVQAPALPVSKIVSAAIVAAMRKRELPVQEFAATLRPLNNVFMPAVAVELAPGPNGIGDLASANYQQRTASAIADAVASIPDRLGVQQ